MFNGKNPLFLWSFSIAMLNYQRVPEESTPHFLPTFSQAHSQRQGTFEPPRQLGECAVASGLAGHHITWAACLGVAGYTYICLNILYIYICIFMCIMNENTLVLGINTVRYSKYFRDIAL